MKTRIVMIFLLSILMWALVLLILDGAKVWLNLEWWWGPSAHPFLAFAVAIVTYFVLRHYEEPVMRHLGAIVTAAVTFSAVLISYGISENLLLTILVGVGVFLIVMAGNALLEKSLKSY